MFSFQSIVGFIAVLFEYFSPLSIWFRYRIYLSRRRSKMSSNAQQQDSSMSSPASPLVWFQLLDAATGAAYKNSSVTSVLRSSLVVPIVDVFRKAVKAEYSNKLSSVDAGDLYVYKNRASFDNGDTSIEADYLLDHLGTSKMEALIVVVGSTGDEMEVDSSPAITASSLSATTGRSTQADGIDVNREHLERPVLLAKLHKSILDHRIVRLTSPSASGKSSLLNLYKYYREKDAKVIWISCLSPKSCNELLAEIGINLAESRYEKNIGNRQTIIFLDDAQAKFVEEEFWGRLVKHSLSFLPKTVSFIIVSIHLLSGGTHSPTDLGYLPALGRDDFLLSAKESDEFLELPVMGLPHEMKSETLNLHSD